MDLRLTEHRLKEILRRQDPPQFGLAYEASYIASREDAPAKSRPAFVWSKCIGREVSTFTDEQRDALYLILHCCEGLFEIHEQRMAPILRSPHPLKGHPLAVGLDLPESRGSLAIAGDLHLLDRHPVVASSSEDGNDVHIPGCWISEFLLFIKDSAGPYCVHVQVRASRAEPGGGPGSNPKTKQKLNYLLKERAKVEVLQRLYAEIGVRTVTVYVDEIPKTLINNLRHLMLWQKRELKLSDEQVGLVLNGFRAGLSQQASALDCIHATELTHQISMHDQKCVLYRAVFDRLLPVDLFDSHLFIEQPLRTQKDGALDQFSAWFRRGQ